jgi:ribosomal-protein-alanine N-acetyltransferase
VSAPEIEIATVFEPAVVSALMAEAFAGDDGASARGEVWDERSLARLLLLPGVFGLVSMVSGEPVGYLLARQAADEAEVLTLGVRGAQRRRGRGRALLDDLRPVSADARGRSSPSISRGWRRQPTRARVL